MALEGYGGVALEGYGVVWDFASVVFSEGHSVFLPMAAAPTSWDQSRVVASKQT